MPTKSQYLCWNSKTPFFQLLFIHVRDLWLLQHLIFHQNFSISGYIQQFINLFLNSKNSNSPERSKSSSLTHMWRVSETFKCVGNYYNIETIFTTELTLNGSFLCNRWERKLQQTVPLVSNIPCECGRSYIDGSGRPLAMFISEHRHNFREDLLE